MGRRFIRIPPWSVGSCCNSEGAALVLVYLFRDRDRATKFAYSTDVTGRNLSLRMPGTNWAFVMAALDEDIAEDEKAKCHLRLRGFTLLKSDPRRPVRCLLCDTPTSINILHDELLLWRQGTTEHGQSAGAAGRQLLQIWPCLCN